MSNWNELLVSSVGKMHHICRDGQNIVSRWRDPRRAYLDRLLQNMSNEKLILFLLFIRIQINVLTVLVT